MAWNIENRTVLITGGNSGIGKATAGALARQGADVFITARNPEVGRAVADELSHSDGRTVRSMQLDLSDSDSTQAFATRFLNETGDLAVLINNAGVMLGRRATSGDGHEMTFRVNHLGHFELTCLLADRLRASAPARVITVASSAHYSADQIEREPPPGRYRGFRTYSRSKLANVVFAKELARRLEGTGVRSYAVHPGLVSTRLAQDGDSRVPGILWKLYSRRMLTSEEGAATTVYAATDPGLDDRSGAYLSEGRIRTESDLARDESLAEQLWVFSERAVGCRLP
jgi:NAD(P)-dependent dehydrogenase (short-subunit alcohol dehydrogenase family)